MMQKITPFLWFDSQAEEAANFYCSIFKSSKVGNVVRGPDGSVMVVPFQLEGEEFTALNGGPRFKFTEAVSFVVHCDNQEEVDYYWSKLTGSGGQESQCGWLKDKFGLSWQVVPRRAIQLLSDPATSKRVMEAILPMKKIDIKTLEDAAVGR
jgi:predicted 3-demethylubiquinone-9 3-methyltransferase (glyoxalase superfamily)